MTGLEVLGTTANHPRLGRMAVPIRVRFQGLLPTCLGFQEIPPAGVVLYHGQWQAEPGAGQEFWECSCGCTLILRPSLELGVWILVSLLRKLAPTIGGMQLTDTNPEGIIRKLIDEEPRLKIACRTDYRWGEPREPLDGPDAVRLDESMVLEKVEGIIA